MKVQKVGIDSLSRDPSNARKHGKKNLDAIKASLRKFGQQKPIVVDNKGIVLAGNGTLEAAIALGWSDVHAVTTTLKDWEKSAYAIADNRTGELADWDIEVLEQQIESLNILDDFDIDDIGFDDNDLEELFGKEELSDEQKLEQDESKSGPYDDFEAGALNAKFGVPPFSVLDGRAGYWRVRKKYWRGLIDDTGESREGVLGGSIMSDINGGTSLLDPVLIEILVKWFTNDGFECANPFTGDAVFGYVATALGRKFTGIELREEQVAINRLRVPTANYICDDGQNIGKHLAASSQDFIFSCPPYFDLEVYSDLPNDASNQEYDGFVNILRNGLTGAFACLKPDRFAAIVIGDVRAKSGYYLGLDVLVKQIASECGLGLYNDFVLVEPVGTGALRATTTFNGRRKHIKMHQNVIVFYKGDVKAIGDNFKPLVDAGFEDLLKGVADE